jgi:hypothetical protein
MIAATHLGAIPHILLVNGCIERWQPLRILGPVRVNSYIRNVVPAQLSGQRRALRRVRAPDGGVFDANHLVHHQPVVWREPCLVATTAERGSVARGVQELLYAHLHLRRHIDTSYLVGLEGLEGPVERRLRNVGVTPTPPRIRLVRLPFSPIQLLLLQGAPGVRCLTSQVGLCLTSQLGILRDLISHLAPGRLSSACLLI